MNNMTLALRIKEVREQNRFTQEQVSKALGISRQAYIRLEQGKRTVSFVDIQTISDLFDIDYKTITDIENKQDLSLVSLCRDEDCSEKAVEAFKKIEKLLDVLSAQEQLNFRMNELEMNELEVQR